MVMRPPRSAAGRSGSLLHCDHEPGVQPPAPQPGVLEHDQVVAGGDAGAAVGDDRLGAVDAGRLEAAAQLVAREQAAVLAEVLARREAAGARDVAGPRVDRVRALAEVALALAGVDHGVRGIGRVVGARERLRRPRAGGELGRLPPGRLGLERPVPGGDAAVEQRGLPAGRAQHPHQPRGDHAALVVVGDHGVAVADPELAPSRARTPPGRAAGGGPPAGSRARRASPRARRTRRRAGARGRTRRGPGARRGTSGRRRARAARGGRRSRRRRRPGRSCPEG